MNKVLTGLKASNLKEIAKSCGTKLIGTKSELIEALNETSGAMDLLNPKPVRVLSLDPGVVNLGLTQLVSPPPNQPISQVLVEKCCRSHIDVTAKSSNPEFAKAAVSFLHEKLTEPIDFVIIEQQRSRTAGSPSIPNAVLRANILEGMLFAVLQSSYPNITALSVSPKSIVNFWDSSKSRTYTKSKEVRRVLVEEWLASKKVRFEPETRQSLQSLKGKKDDVFDSLVQAVTWVTWRRNMYNYFT